MSHLFTLLLCFLAFHIALPLHASDKNNDKITWHPWSEDLFAKAKKEKKLLILDLEAVWCHWCHVMEKETYGNNDVAKFMQENYIAIRVDQESRPDIANRYQDYGWPATVIFDGNGKELTKRSGFIQPQKFLTLLKAYHRDPTPGPEDIDDKEEEIVTSSSLNPKLRTQLEKLIDNTYDNKLGAWKRNNKFLDGNLIDYFFMKEKLGQTAYRKKAEQTLKFQLALMDPVWGGVYQYSTGGEWTNPHFEKIMYYQTENLRVYAHASLQFADAKYLKTANTIRNYLAQFLTSPEGAFYTSQDADLIQGVHSEGYFAKNDKARRAEGIPRIDKHIYSRENGWVIRTLAQVYGASGDKDDLKKAITAAEWIIKNRSSGDGTYRHDEKDAAGPFLSDTVSMGYAFLNLYSVTGDRKWFKLADAALQVIPKKFANPKGANLGFVSHRAPAGSLFASPINTNENFLVARFANLMSFYTGKPDYKKIAQSAMSVLSTPALADDIFVAPSALIMDYELTHSPVHIVIVGGKNDPEAQSLFSMGMKYPDIYKVLEWYDRTEGPLPNSEIQYPQLPKAAAFACNGNRCSFPAFNAKELNEQVNKLRTSVKK